MSKEIIVFKLGAQHDGAMSAESVFDAHFYHALNQEGKVLFTTKTKVSRSRDIDKLILMTLPSNKVVIANVERFETYSDAKVKGYTVPSQWSLEETSSELEQDTYQKFGLSDFKVMKKSELTNYVNVSTDKPLVDSISGANHRIYVDVMDA